jgi:Zn-dependent protease
MSLAASPFDRFTPLMFAALLAWILCTVIHEFAHALVAWWGGDDSVVEKGYLTLDPTRFIHPVYTLLIPGIVLLLGGLPLPGAAVMIDRSRLRGPKWGAYVAAAGPAANLLIFLLLCLPLHPLLGLVDPLADRQPTWVYFLAAMAVLNFIAELFNLIPVPPLDGFGIIEHRLPADLRERLHQPQVALFSLGLLFFAFWNIPGASQPFFWMLHAVCQSLGIPFGLLVDGYLLVIHDQPPWAV